MSELSLLATMARCSGTSMVAVDRAARVTMVVGKSNYDVAFDPENAVGKTIDSYFVHDQEHAKLYHKALKNQPQKATFRSTEGGYFEAQIVPLFDEKNEVCGAFSFEHDVTEREKAREIHREQKEKKLEHIFQHSEDGFYLLDSNFVNQRSNAVAARIHRTEGQTEGHVCYQRIFGRDTPCDVCPVVNTLQTRQSAEVSYFDENLQKHLQLRSAPLFDPLTGELTGVLETLRDISETVAFETEIQSRELFITDIFASIQDGIFIIDPAHTIIKTNPAFEAMYSEHLPLVGKKCFITSCLDHVCDHCPATTVFETGKTATAVHYENPTETQSGRWLEQLAYPITTPSGEVVAAIFIIRDITQRKADEEALEQYRSRLEQLINERTRELERNELQMQTIIAGGSMPIVFADADGRVTFTNAAFRALTGHSEKELIGTRFWDTFYDERTETDVGFLEQRASFYSGETDHIRQDITIRRKDGETRWVDLTASAVTDYEGKRIQLIFILFDITERYKMAQVISVANELAKIMLNTMPSGCLIIDKDGNVLDSNAAEHKMLDIPSKQEYNSRFSELSPEYQPDGRLSSEKFIDTVSTVLETGYMRFEWMHQKLDGTPVPCEVTVVRAKWGDGYVVVAYTRDLREHKAMLATIREANERTQFMLDATPLACALFDMNGNVIDCNMESVKLSELSSKQEFCERYYDLSPEYQPCGRLSAEIRIERFKSVMKAGYRCDEWMHQKLDGTPVPSEVTLVRLKRGGDYIIAAYSRDLREQKKHEAEQERDRQRTNVLLELAQMAQQPETEITDYVIRSIVSLTDSTIGYFAQLDHTKADTLPFRSLIVDQKCACALPAMTEHGTPHALSPVLTECLTTGQAVIHDDLCSLPEVRTSPAGHYEVHSHMNVPVMDGGTPIGIIGVGNKGTPYTEMDAKQLTLLAQGLGNLVSRKKYAENLEKAKVDAENANKAKSEFLAHMSHEIRTPLNGVIGLSDLLAGTPLNEKQREYVQLISASGNALLFLINDILDFSKIEAGKLEIDAEPFDLSATIGSVLASLVSRAAEKNLELAVSLSRNLPRIVEGDSGRIRQILLNLAGNAVKFTDHGGVRIDVAVESTGKTSLTIKFSVIDTGIGIPQSSIDRLFKAFSQVDTSSARVYGGTGLGLAISMKLVRLMDGEIGVKSLEGKGSEFWFTIPFGCDPEVLQCLWEGRCSDIPEPNCPNIDGRYCTIFVNREIPGEYGIRGHSVLVVDDNEIQRDALRIQLEHWGLVCTTCDSGEEALRLADEYQRQKKPFDLFIIDSTLVDDTGTELARRLFEREVRGDLKAAQIILLRSLSDDFDQEVLDDYRAEFVGKPVFASTLFDAVINRIFAAKIKEKIDSGIMKPGDLENIRQAKPSLQWQTESTKHSLTSKDRLKSHLAGKVHVLVVEDNRVNQIVAKNLLIEAGFTCDIAPNGIKACSAVRNKQYDVILMDCQMPEMDGYEATDLIRNWEREYGQKRLPIIALTANATKEDVRKCLDAGMDAYCSKPINPPAVIRLIEEWYEKKESEG